MNRMSVAEARAKGYLPATKAKKQKSVPAVTTARWDLQTQDDYYIITIPEQLPSLNVWNKWHWSTKSQLLNYLANSIGWLVNAKRVPCLQRPQVKVVYYFRTRRRRDKDNYAPKFILDALRYARIIAEDNAEVLELLPVEFKVDKVSPRVEVWVKERKPDG